jgi:gamma-glutamyl phosphate reductase
MMLATKTAVVEKASETKLTSNPFMVAYAIFRLYNQKYTKYSPHKNRDIHASRECPFAQDLNLDFIDLSKLAVAGLIQADNLNQVIEWINTPTDLGHSTCIMTESAKQARKFAREINAGNIDFNVGVPQPYAFFP